MGVMVWVWLAAIVVFGVVEIVTAGLVSIWFVAGSLAALAAAIAGGPPLAQMVLFVGVSAVALVLSRPLAKKITAAKTVATNADRVLGQQARVTETVDNRVSMGAVYVDGKTWTARSSDGSVIPAGETVRVEKIEGVKLFVEKISSMEGTTSCQ